MSDKRTAILPAIDSVENQRRRRWRMFKDGTAYYGVGIGGVSVIIAIVLIFFYLLYVVIPLFAGADIKRISDYSLPGGPEASLYMAMEEQAEIGFRLLRSGKAIFFDTKNGEVKDSISLPIPPGAEISAFAAGQPGPARIAVGFSNGTALVIRHVYDVTYPNNVRLITPSIAYPLGEEPLDIDENGTALTNMAFQDSEDGATLVAQTAGGRLLLTHFTKESSFLSETPTIEQQQVALEPPDGEIFKILLDKEQRNLYIVMKDGGLVHYDLSDKEDPKLVERMKMLKAGQKITSIQFLSGDISLLVGDSSGRIVQWFSVNDDRGNKVLAPIREFKRQQYGIRGIAPEYNRKGFITANENGQLSIYHATANRLLLNEPISKSGLSKIAVSPRADAILAEDRDGEISFWHVHNEHPEISWSVLWGKVWYESYDEPKYLWQSSAATNDFEPKLSLTPLVFGTIKAAFYAMLLAVPLAIMGAIYTANFMAPRMRRIVKPSIETMEALPTVILGFLAGLWLAPMVEANLPGIFSLLLIVPLGVFVFSYLWQHVPTTIRKSIPEGWDAALLIPVVILLGWIAFSLSQPIEFAFFGGDVRSWMKTELGIGFDQRNSLVVGLAMGFAVIPTIFSITEDAIFSVPKHLAHGSLALGATPWQTLVRVIILTASPGIFSAVMIGLGRAVGETMIVLMATGNTPVMDLSIFQGMRTLSANIAVEMPESEVASTHYRVLFLAALVLFAVTFIFNTLAEIVRQRLRLKYSSL